MKNLIVICTVLLGFQYSNAQEFLETNTYKITESIQDKGQEYEPYTIHLVSSEDTSDIELATLTITDPELFETVLITTLENPGLEDVKEIVKVEVEYLACCAHVEVHYFVVTENNDFIALPRLENVYCADSNTDLSYVFPNQEYGVVNNILKTEVLYTEMGEVKYVGLKQSFAWNDDDFGTFEIAAQ